MKGHAIKYSEAELVWIEANKATPRAELYQMFQDKFFRSDVSETNLKALCKRKGWLTGRTGQFAPGNEPWSKGQKMPHHPNSAATRFKKGHRGGKALQNYKPIGTERISKDGYLERKMHDEMPLRSRWRAVHLINWEAANGPIPDGHCLKCLDGDKTNCDPSNWKLISRAMLPRLSGRWRLGYDDAPPELKPTVLAVAELEQKAREAKALAK